MGLIIALFIVALIFVGLGFAIHLLWIVAVVLFLLWIISFFMRGTDRRMAWGRRRRR
ncbi:MAG: hydrophobic protein [Acidimicrobiales bacterium]